MKFLNGEYHVEVKDHRFKIHPNENIILRLRDPPKGLRTQYKVQKATQIRKNQKVNKNDNDQLVVENYPNNKQSTQQKQNFKPPKCPSCKQNVWLEFDKEYCCQNCEYSIKNKNIKLIKKFLDKIEIFQLE